MYFVDDHFTQSMIDMTWKEVEEAAQKNAYVLLPLGVIEEHGPHLSLGVDTYLVYQKCVLIRDSLRKEGKEAIIAPPFYWGVNKATSAFPGCFTSRPETVEYMITDIVQSLKNFGFKNVFGINHHGDPEHALVLIEAFRKAGLETGVNARYVLEYRHRKSYNITGDENHITALGPEVIETPEVGFLDMHAAAVETAQMLKFYPGQVKKEMIDTLENLEPCGEDVARWIAGGPESREITPDGYLGRPKEHHKVIVQFEKYSEGIAKYIIPDAI